MLPVWINKHKYWYHCWDHLISCGTFLKVDIWFYILDEKIYEKSPFHGFFSSLPDGVISWVRADRDLHHQFPRGEDNLWALWAGPEDLPEPQSEVCGEEHCPGLWIREGVGGALQACGRASFFTSGVHWWTLPGGQLVLSRDLHTWSSENQSVSKELNLNSGLYFFHRVLRKYWAWTSPESFKTFWQKLRLVFTEKSLSSKQLQQRLVVISSSHPTNINKEKCWKNAVQSNICRDKTSIINTQTKHHSVIYIKVREQASGLSWKRCKLYNCPFSRGSSIPRCARPVGTLPSSRARCAMAARCLCSATASRIPSKPSSALPATRTACSRVWAAASECVQCLTQHPHFRLPLPDRNCNTGSEL